jgi:hypothetical protein
MKAYNISINVTFMALLSSTLAFPGAGWKRKMEEIKARAAAPITGVEDSNEMLGDLVTPGPVTPVGQVRIYS